MKFGTQIIRFAMVMAFVAAAFGQQGNHQVRGYTKRSTGTYVAPHRQTNPDRTQHNNWSTKGNTNPYTGKRGTKTATR